MTQVRIHRRIHLLGGWGLVCGLLGLGLAGCEDKKPAGNANAAAAGNANTAAAGSSAGGAASLNVYNWQDYIADDTIAHFEKANNIKVQYDQYDTNQVLQQKLLVGKSGYDVVYPSAHFAGNQIVAKLFQKLDLTKLPNYKNLDPDILQQLAVIDPGNQYLVPYMWGTNGVGYNIDRVKKALGNTPLPKNPFDLIFDPKYTSKVTKCGLAFSDEPQTMFSMANIYQGRKANDFSKDALTKSVALLKKVRKDIRTFETGPIDAMANGDLCVGIMFNGDLFIAKDRSVSNQKPQNLDYLAPNNTLMWTDVMAIPADAPHPDKAYLWINTMLDPQVIAAISNKVSYANPNLGTKALVKPELVNNPKVYITAEQLKTLQPGINLDQNTQTALIEAYNEFKEAK